MKLCTLSTERGSVRDGALAIVSRDLRWCALAQEAPTMIAALENWASVEPRLKERYEVLTGRGDKAPGAMPFDPKRCMAPLPRSFGFFDGSAFLSHVERARKARGDQMPESAKKTPLMYQGISDNMRAGHSTIELVDEAYGGDFEGEFAMITIDVPRGTTAKEMPRYAPLLTVFNDVTFREIVKTEIETKFGFLQGKPNNSFAPVVVTPDEFGSAWRDGRLAIDMEVTWNNEKFGRPNGSEMHFSFYELLAHACKTRPLSAGTILGTGTISNQDLDRGFACLTEKRFVEMARDGKPTTRWLKPGDSVRIDAKYEGSSPFGIIDQKVVLS